MGCCGAAPEGCDILRDDFTRDSLETLTFSSQSSSTYGWYITMTSTPTACIVGDTLTGQSTFDSQFYSYYVTDVSASVVKVEFLYVETPDESLDPDPETQGITSFTVKRLGSDYAVSDTTQPANYLYGIGSDGLVASNTEGEYGNRSWLELTGLSGKQNFKLDATIHHYGSTEHTLEIHTMTTDANVDDYYNGVKFVDNSCTTCTTTNKAHIQFAAKYKYPHVLPDDPPSVGYERRREPFEHLETPNPHRGGYQSSANTIPVNGVYYKDDSININYCQKEYVESIKYNRFDLSKTLNYVSATVTVGIENGLALVGAATMYGKNTPTSADPDPRYQYGGSELSNRTFIKNTKPIQAKSLVVQYNDRQSGKQICGSCISDMTCSELQLLPQYIDSRDRDVEQTVYDLGFVPSEVTTHSYDQTITYNSTDEKSLFQPGIGSASEVWRGGYFRIPMIQFSGGRYSYSMIDSSVGEIYGLYSEMTVQFNASDSYVDNGYRLGIDGDGNGYYSNFHYTTLDPADLTYDTRITTGKEYTVGWCLLPVYVPLPTSISTWDGEAVVWRMTSWIQGYDFIIA